MTRQRAALEFVIGKCREVDPECGIQLQGSVARGEERPDSDIDLTVVTSRADGLPFNEFISRENHFAMTRVRLEKHDVDVDINWLSVDELVDLVKTHGASDWWMFYRGTPVHDPGGSARRCHRTISEWFDRNPSVAEAWNRQQAEVEKHKKNPEHALRFSTQPAFCAHLRKMAERKR
jgi:predicted nucleotidyltransferase